MPPGRAGAYRTAVDCAAKAIALCACCWFAFAAAWGMFQIPAAGHINAASAASAGFAEPIARGQSWYPSNRWYLPGPPPPTSYYCHHPLGVYWLTALCDAIFGHRDFVVHLPPVLLSFAIPPLLYGIGKQHWGAGVGAVAASAYVVVPIALGFSNFNNHETATIFGALLFFWGHSRHQSTGKRRHLAAALLGAAAACAADWAGYLMILPLLTWALVRAFVLPRGWTPRLDFRNYARWWALSVAIAGATFALWMALFFKAGKLDDWLASEQMRGGGADVGATGLRAALAARTNWIDFSFTPLAVALGKIALPVCIARALIVRRDEEFYALSALFGASVQYVAFKRGADVHIFWSHDFAAYYALATAQLSRTFGSLVLGGSRLLGAVGAPGDPSGRLRRAMAGSSTTGAWAALSLGMLPSILMAPDAVRSLSLWRRTGGRYDDKGSLIRDDADLLFTVRNVIVPKKRPGDGIDVSPATGWGWEHVWTFVGPHNAVSDPSAGAAPSSNHPFWVGRASALPARDQTRIAAEAHVQAYGDIWVVDQRNPAAPVDAWRVEEREPNLFEWLVFGGWEPVRAIGAAPDPLRTWEWRVHLGQPATTPTPSAETRTLDDLRIAHNVAVFSGADSRAEALREQITRVLDRSAETRFDEGITLIGTRLTRGAQPRLEIWFEASGPTRVDSTFRVRSTVEGRAWTSLVPIDTTDREMAYPFRLPTSLWRRGFVYELDVVLNHRIGRERYWGAWASRGGGPAPRRLDGRAETTLAVLP